ncbi:MAG: hypothetical protein AUK37_04645 [Rhodobacterales bacterium CG2_30_65_12]|nr:MAG: hypothetical protein AUK37_04645 [Rhodobacterales bacterium CG2_30_65_12]
MQASHVGEPLRLGGLAVTIGLAAGALVLSVRSDGVFTRLLLLSAVPVFLAGFAEDLGYRVSPRGRFLASVIGAIVAIYLLGLWVPRGSLPGLDAVMGFAPTAIFVTIMVAAFFCHSVNLVDGMNGLASFTVGIGALGISVVAGLAGLGEISALAALLAVATMGFLPLNWPVARMFLGDGGAYGLGHILIWLAIATVARSADVAVPAMLLVLFWPFADTIHSILRRALAGKPITEADRMHLHQKVRRGIEIVWLGRDSRALSNPIATLILMPMIAAPVVTGVYMWRAPMVAWLALAAYGLVFSLMHLLITLAARNFRRSGAASDTQRVRLATVAAPLRGGHQS